MNAAYDVLHLTPGGVQITHHEGPLETDGPWLILRGGRTGVLGPEAGDLEHLFPAHAVVSVDPCEGRCRDGRE